MHRLPPCWCGRSAYQYRPPSTRIGSVMAGRPFHPAGPDDEMERPKLGLSAVRIFLTCVGPPRY